MREEVPIRDGSIRLGQLLKLADVVSSGADVKGLLAGGTVRVNGVAESRRGRTLYPGDEVSIAGATVRVIGPPPLGEEDSTG